MKGYKKIYLIEKKNFGNFSQEIFQNYNDFRDSLDSEVECMDRGTYEALIYEIPSAMKIDTSTSEGIEYGTQSRKNRRIYRTECERLQDYTPIFQKEIDYINIYEEEEGKWQCTGSDEEYNSYEEAFENEKPSNWIGDYF